MPPEGVIFLSGHVLETIRLLGRHLFLKETRKFR